MVSIANKKAKFEQLEGLKGVKYGVDELRVDILELCNLRPIVEQVLVSLFLLVNSDQRLVAFELLEKLRH